MTVTLILASGGAIGFMLTFLTAITRDAHQQQPRTTKTVKRLGNEISRVDDNRTGDRAA